MRGATQINRGDLAKGIADIETAIRLNPADPATAFETRSKGATAAADLQHGEQQVQQMLKDRPVMGQYGEKAGVLLPMGRAQVRG